MLPENWGKLTPDQKFQTRIAGYLSTENKGFATVEVAQAYQVRSQRYVDVLELKQPDHVPIGFMAGNYPVRYAQAMHRDMFYDYKKAVEVNLKFLNEFELEYQAVGSIMPGPAFDLVDYKIYRWPGRHLRPEVPFQYVEGEYMRADEYDHLIADPEDFLLRVYMPRVFGALGALETIVPLTATTEITFLPPLLANFGQPALQRALKTLMDAGRETLEWMNATSQVGMVALGEKGLPKTAGGFSKAPFDFIADTLRGTRAMMLDLYRQPQKVLTACEALVPIAVRMGVNAASQAGIPFVSMPLHKGADGFMSPIDFKKFYWPTLKAVVLGLIQEGVVPSLFVEGSYDQRLDIIAESGLPAGRTIWIFDKTDMASAKQKFGGWACIAGNVPASLFTAGTPHQIEDSVKHLMEICAPGGGYYISPGAGVDVAEEANIRAYFKAAREYGTY